MSKKLPKTGARSATSPGEKQSVRGRRECGHASSMPHWQRGIERRRRRSATHISRTECFRVRRRRPRGKPSRAYTDWPSVRSRDNDNRTGRHVKVMLPMHCQVAAKAKMSVSGLRKTMTCARRICTGAARTNR